jgi:hypothetical protein
MFERSLTRSLVVVGVAMVLAGCSGAANPASQSGGGGPSPAGAPAAAPAETSAAAGTNGYEGTLTSSGLYAATWTVAPGVVANPFNSVGNATLNSDKGTFGNISVMPDGSVAFGSAATEMGHNGSFDGSGAKVTLDPSGQFVCAFTVDTDLKGSTDGAVLHVAGGMTVHWHPLGDDGDLNCP